MTIHTERILIFSPSSTNSISMLNKIVSRQHFSVLLAHLRIHGTGDRISLTGSNGFNSPRGTIAKLHYDGQLPAFPWTRLDLISRRFSMVSNSCLIRLLREGTRDSFLSGRSI